MANQLAMADVQAILKLHESRWSNRRIAQELGVDRETVAKYIRAAACDSKPAKAPIGSPGVSEAQGNVGWPLPAVASGEEKGIAATMPGCSPEPVRSDSKPAKAPIGSDPIPAEAPIGSEPLCELGVASQASPGVGQAGIAASAPPCGRSACEPYRQVILEKLEQGLSAQRIYQDLVGDGFAHKYHSARRFVAKLQSTNPLPFRRMECAPGEEAQIDFGTGAWIDLPDGKRRRSHVFRIVLSHSRKGYSEAVHRQTTEDFIRAMENAFLAFSRGAQSPGG
jgi:hypothetical protein